MNRLLIPLALVVLVAGCAMPSLFGQQADQPVAVDTARTVVVREIYHEPPVVYVDTVYMAADPEPVQPVYVENEYNEYSEYNEYNHTDVYVHEQVVVPPRPHREERRWSPGEHERRPGDRRRDGESGRERNRPRDPDKPRDVKPQHPVKQISAPVANDRQQAPPVRPVRPMPVKRQAPAGSVSVTSVQAEAPKQALTPAVDTPAATEADVAVIREAASPAVNGQLAARIKK